MADGIERAHLRTLRGAEPSALGGCAEAPLPPLLPPAPWLVNASDDGFACVADSALLPVLVDVWGRPWCAPLLELDPALEQMATGLADRAKLVRVNVESAPQLIHRFRSLPTLLVPYRGERWHARAA